MVADPLADGFEAFLELVEQLAIVEDARIVAIGL